MANIEKAFTATTGISLGPEDNIGIFEGSNDPSAGAGEAAPIGSLFIRENGELWQKTTAPDTGWTINTSVTVSDLNDLADVTLTSIQDGDAIYYDSATEQWINTPLQVPNSGRIVQVKFGPIPAQAGTVSIPKDTTSPLISEGLELWNQDLTPTANTSIIRISSSFSVSASNSSQEIIFAIFRGNTCIGVSTDAVANSSEAQSVTFTFYDNPATTNAVTYSARVGKITGDPGTWYINTLPGFTPGTEYGGVLTNNAFTVEEISNA